LVKDIWWTNSPNVFQKFTKCLSKIHQMSFKNSPNVFHQNWTFFPQKWSFFRQTISFPQKWPSFPQKNLMRFQNKNIFRKIARNLSWNHNQCFSLLLYLYKVWTAHKVPYPSTIHTL
jgi:hypothetical protein